MGTGQGSSAISLSMSVYEVLLDQFGTNEKSPFSSPLHFLEQTRQNLYSREGVNLPEMRPGD